MEGQKKTRILYIDVLNILVVLVYKCGQEKSNNLYY